MAVRITEGEWTARGGGGGGGTLIDSIHLYHCFAIRQHSVFLLTVNTNLSRLTVACTLLTVSDFSCSFFQYYHTSSSLFGFACHEFHSLTM